LNWRKRWRKRRLRKMTLKPVKMRVWRKVPSLKTTRNLKNRWKRRMLAKKNLSKRMMKKRSRMYLKLLTRKNLLQRMKKMRTTRRMKRKSRPISNLLGKCLNLQKLSIPKYWKR